MKTWLIILLSIIAVIAFVMLISFLSTTFILRCASKISTQMNQEYVKKIMKYLPNKKCENCSYDDCEEYALELLQKRSTFICPLCSKENKDKINKIIDEFYAQFNQEENVKKPVPFWRRNKQKDEI